MKALSPPAASRLIRLALVLIELPPQVFLCADVIVVVGVGREELELAVRARRQDRNLVHARQDNEAALRVEGAVRHKLTFATRLLCGV